MRGLVFLFVHWVEAIYLKIDAAPLAIRSRRPHMQANCSGFRRSCEQQAVNVAGAAAAEAGGLSVRALLHAETFRGALWTTCV